MHIAPTKHACAHVSNNALCDARFTSSLTFLRISSNSSGNVSLSVSRNAASSVLFLHLFRPALAAVARASATPSFASSVSPAPSRPLRARARPHPRPSSRSTRVVNIVRIVIVRAFSSPRARVARRPHRVDVVARALDAARAVAVVAIAEGASSTVVNPRPVAMPATDRASFERDVVARAERFARDALASNDGSHDLWHVERVRASAVALARLEGANAFVCELAALLHDVDDWKYARGDGAKSRARTFLEGSCADVDAATRETVLDVCARIGFKSELEKAEKSRADDDEESVEFRCVQDADRLDAIGAIGIGRTFCFGGARGNPMHVPGVPPMVDVTAARYEAAHRDETRPNTTINHFHEKLFRLRGLMKTASGRARAERRHATMVEFVERFHREWDGDE